jgi:hypothetical protein
MHHDGPVPGRLSGLSSRRRSLAYGGQRRNRQNSCKHATNSFHMHFLPLNFPPITLHHFVGIVNSAQLAWHD